MGVDMDEIKEEKAEGCQYRKNYKNEMWCTYFHKNKENTSQEDIDTIGENESNEQIYLCPAEMDECPIDRWTSQDAWTDEDWKEYYAELKRD